MTTEMVVEKKHHELFARSIRAAGYIGIATPRPFVSYSRAFMQAAAEVGLPKSVIDDLPLFAISFIHPEEPRTLLAMVQHGGAYGLNGIFMMRSDFNCQQPPELVHFGAFVQGLDGTKESFDRSYLMAAFDQCPRVMFEGWAEVVKLRSESPYVN
ncbi:MAG TPA: hypothetical protein VHB73_06000 [Alphaproteobacteria bacterium]|nr:hypothetical protein [Alphaproteobacteria bacterium]